MSNRQLEITSFLKTAYQYKLKYPQNFDSYQLLKFYDVDQSEINLTFDNYFSYWINYYQNNPNVNIGIDRSQPDFLHIQNNSNTSDIDFIKIYINVSSHGCFNTVTKITEFLSKHPEIEHVSKVSQNRRSDQIVLRVRNINEAKALVDLVNNDPAIAKDLKKTNPFLMQCGQLGLSYDYMLSYNSFMSYLIDEYLKTKSDIESINSDDFKNFLENYYKQLFDPEYYERYVDFTNSEMFISNFRHLKIVKPSSDINDAVVTLASLISEYLSLQDKDSLAMLEATREYTSSEDYKSTNKQSLEYIRYVLDIKCTLDEYIKYLYTAKGEPLKDIESRISNFINNRDSSDLKVVELAYRNITKDNNYREMFINKMHKYPFYKYLVPNGDILTYVENVLRDNNLLQDYDKQIS